MSFSSLSTYTSLAVESNNCKWLLLLKRRYLPIKGPPRPQKRHPVAAVFVANGGPLTGKNLVFSYYHYFTCLTFSIWIVKKKKKTFSIWRFTLGKLFKDLRPWTFNPHDFHHSFNLIFSASFFIVRLFSNLHLYNSGNQPKPPWCLRKLAN